MDVNANLVSGVVVTKIQQHFMMLMLKRSGQNYWCNVAGNIEHNEIAWKAMLRELKEETQLTATNLYHADYLQQFYYPEAEQIYIATGFVVFCEPGQNVVLNNEHTEYRWCTLQQAIQLAAFPNQAKFYEHVWKYFIDQNPSSNLKIPIKNL